MGKGQVCATLEKELRKSLSDEVTFEQRSGCVRGRRQVIIWKTSPGRENNEKSLPLGAVLSWEMWAIFRRRGDLGQGSGLQQRQSPKGADS